MPIIWRYITKTYLKIFALSLFTLFALSFLIKHKKLTLLIVTGASFKQALLLTLCMLSITLPHIIGVCTFLSALLTSYKLNSSGEITSLRANGLSFFKIFSPIYFFGAFLLLFNFFLVAEFIPYAKLVVNKLYLESHSINPLILLRKNNLPNLKHLYTEMDLSSNGLEAKDMLIAYYREGENKISLFLGDHFEYLDQSLYGNNVSLITYLPTKIDCFDHLFIESQDKIKSPESFFISLLNKPSKVKESDIYPLKLLIKSRKSSAKSEVFQRFSKIFYPFTFTILGVSAGLFGYKSSDKKNIFFLLLSVFGYFISFFALKNTKLPFMLGVFYTIFPHIMILFFSFLKQKKIVLGKI